MSLVMDDQFEGGAVEGVRYVSKDRIEFQTPLHGSPQGMWFAFRVRGGAGRRLEFIQTNVHQMLGSTGYRVVQPVMREGPSGEWTRLPAEECRFDLTEGAFSFTLTPQSDETYVAFTYPYGPAELRRFLQAHVNSPYLHRETLGKTGEGRDFPVLLLGNLTETASRQLCAFVARQHAGETPGSFVLEGILDAFLSDTTEGEWCRQNLVFFVAPFVDLDGVIEGRYGKDRPPRDFNRDWCSDPLHPEIAGLIARIHELTEQMPYRLFVDLHAPAPHDPSFWLPSRLSLTNGQWAEMWSLGRLLESLAPSDCPARVRDYPFHALNWSQELYEQTATYFQTFRYGVLAATLETAYHRHTDGGYVTPAGWKGLGRSFVAALVQHFQQEAYEEFTGDSAWSAAPPVLQHWTLVVLPHNVALEEHSETRLILMPQNEGGQAWFTCNRFFSSANVQLRFIGAEDPAVEVLVYFYRNGLPTGDRQPIYLEPGTDTLTMAADLIPEKTDSIRFSFRLTAISAPLEIRIEEISPIEGRLDVKG
jgi:hypothetical protein